MDVSAVARGYLSLINANNRGTGLAQAADYIMPVVDLTQFLGLSQRAFYQANGNHVVGVNVEGVTIPAGETWIIRAGGARWTNDATAQLSWGGLEFVPPNYLPVAGQVPASPHVGPNTVANNAVQTTFVPPGILLESGTLVRMIDRIVGAGNVAWSFSIIYDRLRG